MTPKGRQEPPRILSKALFASKARIQAHESRKREKQTLKPTQHAKPSRTMTQTVTQIVMVRTKIVTMSVEREKKHVGDGNNDPQTCRKPWSHHHHHHHSALMLTDP